MQKPDPEETDRLQSSIKVEKEVGRCKDYGTNESMGDVAGIVSLHQLLARPSLSAHYISAQR